MYVGGSQGRWWLGLPALDVSARRRCRVLQAAKVWPAGWLLSSAGGGVRCAELCATRNGRAGGCATQLT